MALHSGQAELYQQQNSFTWEKLFSGSQRQNVRRFQHSSLGQGRGLSLGDCHVFDMKHFQYRFTVRSGSFTSFSPGKGELDCVFLPNLNPTFSGKLGSLMD